MRCVVYVSLLRAKRMRVHEARRTTLNRLADRDELTLAVAFATFGPVWAAFWLVRILRVADQRFIAKRWPRWRSPLFAPQVP